MTFRRQIFRFGIELAKTSPQCRNVLFLSSGISLLTFQCGDDVSEWKFDVLGLKRIVFQQKLFLVSVNIQLDDQVCGAVMGKPCICI